MASCPFELFLVSATTKFSDDDFRSLVEAVLVVVFGTTYIAGCFDDVHPMMILIYQTMMMSAMMTDRTSKTLRLFLFLKLLLL